MDKQTDGIMILYGLKISEFEKKEKYSILPVLRSNRCKSTIWLSTAM